MKVIEEFREDLKFHLRIMRKKGITQKEIAEKLNMSESNLSEALKERFNIETILKIAYAANLVVNIEVEQKDVFFDKLKEANELYHKEIAEKLKSNLKLKNNEDDIIRIEETKPQISIFRKKGGSTFVVIEVSDQSLQYHMEKKDTFRLSEIGG